MKKQSLIFFSAISIYILTCSQLASAGSTGQCISGNCFNGYGVATFSDGGRYEGNFVNEVKTGHGSYTYSDGGRYQGNFENDLMNGHGVYEYADGNSYEGDFVNGMKSGYGVYKYSDGSLYKGNFTNENQTGKGVFIATNGNKYPMYNGEISGEASNTVASRPSVSTPNSGNIVVTNNSTPVPKPRPTVVSSPPPTKKVTKDIAQEAAEQRKQEEQRREIAAAKEAATPSGQARSRCYDKCNADYMNVMAICGGYSEKSDGYAPVGPKVICEINAANARVACKNSCN